MSSPFYASRRSLLPQLRPAGNPRDAGQDPTSAIDALPEDTRYEIAFPLDIRPETDRAVLLQSLRSQGFARIATAGQVVRLDEPEAGSAPPRGLLT